MSVDRERIRRDAESVAAWTDEDQHWATVMARHCLTLLAALEQAEEDYDDATSELAEQLAAARTEANALSARLAQMPPLMEALREIADFTGRSALEERTATILSWEEG